MQDFIGEYSIPFPLLDLERPTSQGTFAMPDYYFELRHHLDVAMDAAREVQRELSDELFTYTRRTYPLFEEYELEGAERVIVALGSTAGTAKDVVDELRAAGEPVGLVRDRARSGRFRPPSSARRWPRWRTCSCSTAQPRPARRHRSSPRLPRRCTGRPRG